MAINILGGTGNTTSFHFIESILGAWHTSQRRMKPGPCLPGAQRLRAEASFVLQGPHPRRPKQTFEFLRLSVSWPAHVHGKLPGSGLCRRQHRASGYLTALAASLTQLQQDLDGQPGGEERAAALGALQLHALTSLQASLSLLTWKAVLINHDFQGLL